MRRPLFVPLIFALALVACAGEASDQSVPLPPSNEADVRFLRGLLAVDQRAQRVAAAARSRFEHKEALGLLEAVLDDRQSQLGHARNLLRFIGAEPQGPQGATGPGVTADGEARLGTASGPEALRLFLEMLVQADQEALDLADGETAEGLFPDAKSLAETLRSTRQSELATAQRLLSEAS